MFFLFIFAGLLIAANPYLAVKVYPNNQNCAKIATQYLCIKNEYELK